MTCPIFTPLERGASNVFDYFEFPDQVSIFISPISLFQSNLLKKTRDIGWLIFKLSAANWDGPNAFKSSFESIHFSQNLRLDKINMRFSSYYIYMCWVLKCGWMRVCWCTRIKESTILQNSPDLVHHINERELCHISRDRGPWDMFEKVICGY